MRSTLFLSLIACCFLCVSCSNADSDILHIDKSGDSLFIASVSNFLYYPFGEFKDIKSFEIKYKNVFKKYVESAYPYGDSTMPKKRIYKMAHGSSFVKFIKVAAKDNKRTAEDRLEILSAEIFDSSLVFTNDIRIGMQFDKIVYTGFPALKKKKIITPVRIIMVESGVTGIWHKYLFDDEKLKKIDITTDYQLEITTK